MLIDVRLIYDPQLGRLAVPPTVGLIRYIYDPSIGKLVQNHLCEVDFWADELPEIVQRFISPTERRHWQRFVNDRTRQLKRAVWRRCLSTLPQTLAYAAMALRAGETPPALTRIACKIFTQTLDAAIEAQSPKVHTDWDQMREIEFLLLRTEEETERWSSSSAGDGIHQLPQFAPEDVTLKIEFPSYPEQDLSDRALAMSLHRSHQNPV